MYALLSPPSTWCCNTPWCGEEPLSRPSRSRFLSLCIPNALLTGRRPSLSNSRPIAPKSQSEWLGPIEAIVLQNLCLARPSSDNVPFSTRASTSAIRREVPVSGACDQSKELVLSVLGVLDLGKSLIGTFGMDPASSKLCPLWHQNLGLEQYHRVCTVDAHKSEDKIPARASLDYSVDQFTNVFYLQRFLGNPRFWYCGAS